MQDPTTLVVGLDGATFDIIDEMLRTDQLPTIRGIIEDGSRAVLRSSTPPLSSIAWTTITTGVNPGKHGIFDFAHRAKGTYQFVPYVSFDKEARPIWQMLSENGKSVCIVNVPMTYPAEAVNGIMISGFPAPPDFREGVYPRDLAEEIKTNLPDNDFQKSAILGREDIEAGLVDEIKAKTERQLKLMRYLINKRRFDFVMTVFDGTDVASHSLWKHHDKTHPQYDPERSPQLSDSIYQVYRFLDGAIADLISTFPERPNLILLSDHGSGPVHHGVYVNNWLQERGYLSYKKSLKTRAKFWAFRHGINVYNMFRLARRLKLVSNAESAYASKSLLLDLANRFSLSFLDVDWQRTSVYSFGNFGQFYVNLAGREPQGSVQPGSEYERLLGRLADEVRKITDPATKKTIFDYVVFGRDVYAGPYSSDGPDLLAFDTKMLYNAHRMFEMGTNRLVTPHPVYSGNHKAEGILLTSGPSLSSRESVGPFKIEDITPTVLALQGLEPPHGLDGKVMEELLKEPMSLSVLTVPAKDPHFAHRDQIFSEKENSELLARLKDLGYA